jgi:hypothetical protein
MALHWLPVVALVPALIAQTPTEPPAPTTPQPTPSAKSLAARDFVVENCECIAFADLAQLREREIWRLLRASALMLVLPKLEREAGFPLEHLDRVTLQARMPEDDVPKPGQTESMVWVLEGNAGLGVPDSVARNTSYSRSKVGDVELFERADYVIANPRPDLRVLGTRDLIVPVLEGKPSRGRPSADVLSLLSGHGDNLLYLVFQVKTQRMRERMLGRMFGQVAWPEDDLPTHVMARVRAMGDDDDAHLQVEAVIRHRVGKAGFDASAAAVRTWLESMQKERRFAAIKTVLRGIEIGHEGPDLVLRQDLGRPRDAIGALAALLAAIVGA